MLALRRDLLPAAYIDELELLHDQLPALGFDVVRATVEAELDAPLRELFASFSETPLAAATSRRCMRRRCRTASRGVKVQRPGLEAMIAKDIAALTYLVALGESLSASTRADLSAHGA